MAESLVPWVVRYCQRDLIRAIAVNVVTPIAHHVAQCVKFSVVDWDPAPRVQEQHGKNLLAYFERTKQLKCVYKNIVVRDAVHVGIFQEYVVAA